MATKKSVKEPDNEVVEPKEIEPEENEPEEEEIPTWAQNLKNQVEALASKLESSPQAPQSQQEAAEQVLQVPVPPEPPQEQELALELEQEGQEPVLLEEQNQQPVKRARRGLTWLM